MKIEIRRSGESTEVELDEGEVRLGGGDVDGLNVPGVPPALLVLRRQGDRLVMEALAMLDIDGVPCPPRVPRLLMADEAVALAQGVTLRRLPGPAAPPPPRTGGTVALLRGFLGGAEDFTPPGSATLTCLTGLDQGRVFALSDGESELGRGERVAIRVRDRAVSRRHARVVQGPRGYVLEDLGTPNGLFVNGQKLAAPLALLGGEVIEVGHSLLRFTAPPRQPEPAKHEAAPDPEQATAPQPELETPPARAKRGLRWEWMMVVVGAAFAMLGALVTWGLSG